MGQTLACVFSGCRLILVDVNFVEGVLEVEEREGSVDVENDDHEHGRHEQLILVARD